jgi:hypothetical protein
VVCIVQKKKVLKGEAVQFSCFFLSLHIIVGAKNLLMCACFVACPVQYQKGKRGKKVLIGGLYWDTSLSSFDLSFQEIM